MAPDLKDISLQDVKMEPVYLGRDAFHRDRYSVMVEPLQAPNYFIYRRAKSINLQKGIVNEQIIPYCYFWLFTIARYRCFAPSRHGRVMAPSDNCQQGSLIPGYNSNFLPNIHPSLLVICGLT
jgi:hypothetical protein